jgi:hypothetical protein
VSAIAEPALAVGATIWVHDTNRRPGHEFVEVKITGETPMSWLVGWRGEDKIPKVRSRRNGHASKDSHRPPGDSKPTYYLTRQALADHLLVASARKIGDMVRNTSDTTTLREIARMVGFQEEALP